MTFTQAPSAGTESQAPTLADKIKAIDGQIEEAHMTFDDALVAKLQAEKAAIESQEKSKQEEDASKPPSVAEIVKEGDPVKLAELDDRFAVAQPVALTTESVPETSEDKPLDDAHVDAFKLEKNKEAVEIVINEISGAKSYDELSALQRNGLYKLLDLNEPELSKKFRDAIFNKAAFLVDIANKGDEFALKDISGIIKDLKSKESLNADSRMTGFKMGSVATVLSEEQSSNLLAYANSKFKDITGTTYSVDAVREYVRSFN